FRSPARRGDCLTGMLSPVRTQRCGAAADHSGPLAGPIQPSTTDETHTTTSPVVPALRHHPDINTRIVRCGRRSTTPTARAAPPATHDPTPAPARTAPPGSARPDDCRAGEDS